MLCVNGRREHPNRLSNSSRLSRWTHRIMVEQRGALLAIDCSLVQLSSPTLFEGTGHHNPASMHGKPHLHNGSRTDRRLIILLLIPFVYATSGARDRGDIKPDGAQITKRSLVMGTLPALVVVWGLCWICDEAAWLIEILCTGWKIFAITESAFITSWNNPLQRLFHTRSTQIAALIIGTKSFWCRARERLNFASFTSRVENLTRWLGRAVGESTRD